MVEIILLIALIILPLTLVLILFGKDIKRYITRNYGSARTEAEKLYKHTGGTGPGTIKGQVGAASTGDGGPPDGSGATPATGAGGGGTGDGGTGTGGGRATAPVQSTDRTQRGTGGGGAGEESSPSDDRPASLGLAAIAVCVALVTAMAFSGRRLK